MSRDERQFGRFVWPRGLWLTANSTRLFIQPCQLSQTLFSKYLRKVRQQPNEPKHGSCLTIQTCTWPLVCGTLRQRVSGSQMKCVVTRTSCVKMTLLPPSSTRFTIAEMDLTFIRMLLVDELTNSLRTKVIRTKTGTPYGMFVRDGLMAVGRLRWRFRSRRYGIDPKNPTYGGYNSVGRFAERMNGFI